MNDAQKILIVDDEENIRRIFKKALEKRITLSILQKMQKMLFKK